nr:immunoglobulin heavy chain junction region [Macaca mulatta]MOV42120.1 immunoglobulin heavy chain junction region [Macaca mulatta]MOV43374.1 immunoglobulin heavy chain junction region [Macaca mulatta]MOV44625.1 immunoglobulin heavy chain junction region [Macaca mulatta]MOV46431.1 immunoglobulin heavy chain junction region [Macaca mulatta]
CARVRTVNWYFDLW